MSVLRELNLWAAEYAGALSAVLLAVLIVVAILFWRLNVSMQKVVRRYNSLMKGAERANLETLLERQVELVSQQQIRLDQMAETLGKLAAQADASLQRVGLVRYNAFDGVGGNQSFSLALLDTSGTGIVISSLFGRSESAVYCKAVKDGRPTMVVSREENEAIQQAMASRSVE